MTNQLPSWVSHPEAAEAASGQIADLTEIATREIAAEQIALSGGNPGVEEIADFIVENHEVPGFLALVQERVMRLIAKSENRDQRALMAMARVVSTTGLYHYHPSGYQDPTQLFQTALEGVERNSSTASDLNFIVSVLGPLMTQHKIDGLENIYQRGVNINKTRKAIPQLRQAIDDAKGDDTRLVKDITKIIGAVLDPDLSSREFDSLFPSSAIASNLPRIEAVVFVEPESNIVVCVADDAQLAFIEGVFGPKCRFGFEPDEKLLALLRKRVQVTKGR